ncbi:hypothetical protein HY837_01125 [archaeon]|nr:hypothetical protein [archaeon]
MAEREILGDKKKRKYDEGLIDVVNKQFAEETVIKENIIVPAVGRNIKGQGRAWSEPIESKIIDFSTPKNYDKWLEELKDTAPEIFLKKLFDTQDEIKTLLDVLGFVSKRRWIKLQFNYWGIETFNRPVMLKTADLNDGLYIEERNERGVIRVF